MSIKQLFRYENRYVVGGETWSVHRGWQPWVGHAAFVLGLLAVAAVLVLAIVGLVTWVERTSCRQVAEAMGRGHVYRIPAGCFVEAEDGQLVPRDMLREVE